MYFTSVSDAINKYYKLPIQTGFYPIPSGKLDGDPTSLDVDCKYTSL